ncbi:aminodeoxychorismate lyase [Halalkalibacter alkalisediminis]|uniref:aminodeoxychorismate lyase n=1 Tax=Halalkalibacter alkalisediminis TaxID=935616 RepID=A0ABV6NH76_9BACI|nr:aminodeoxychorismate lyase [Halalkalibacter alkalisediminis]
MFVYVNGAIVPKEEALVSAFDHGYLYGLGLFETFRVENGHPFLLDDHFQRLQEGLETLGIAWSMSKSEVVKILKELLAANQLDSAYVRWNVAAGAEELGLYTGEYREPTVIVYMKPLPAGSAEKEASILSLRRNTPEGSYRLKSHHYLNNVLAKRELGDAIKSEGIFLTEEGFVAEGIVSNVFWVKNGMVYTPSIDTGILDGITRRFVLALLDKKSIPYEVGFYQESELLDADEAFITNSIQEIVPLCSINGITLKGERSITGGLMREFDRYRDQLWSRSEIFGGR